MVQLADLDINESHPLAAELSSLRKAVTQLQACHMIYAAEFVL